MKTDMTPGARLLDGRQIAAAIKAESKERAARLKERGAAPKCSVIVVTGDDDGNLYAENIARAGAAVGIEVQTITIEREGGTSAALAAIALCMADPTVHGAIIQRPLPPGFDSFAIAAAINPHKDVDGTHPFNIGALTLGMPSFVPATAAAVMELLHHPDVPGLGGARVVVLGRSLVVGKPLALLLVAANATVTICHSHTVDLPSVCREADVLIAAVGRPRFVTADMVKPGATVIDVGTNVVDGRLVGDVDAESVASVAGILSPVPGGVGPITTAVLLRSVVDAAEAIP